MREYWTLLKVLFVLFLFVLYLCSFQLVLSAIDKPDNNQKSELNCYAHNHHYTISVVGEVKYTDHTIKYVRATDHKQVIMIMSEGFCVIEQGGGDK